MAHVTDKSFTDYAVANRSFGPFYQAMSFLNTWWPGGIFLAITGLAASGGDPAIGLSSQHRLGWGADLRRDRADHQRGDLCRLRGLSPA
jgi:Na+/proline symporter